ncbi:MAG: type II and III secretion system protein family protein [Panacagrimonas sp.]
MNPLTRVRSLLQVFAVMVTMALGAGGAVAAPATATATAEDSVIRVEVGTHKLIREKAGIRRVAVGDPATADVNVIDGRELLITGKKLGVTSLLVWIKSSPAPKEFRIRVGDVQDPTKLARPDPELASAGIERGAGLDGKLPNLLAYRRARTAATKSDALVDQSVVEGDFQVMTEIKIAEVNRTTAKRYGLGLNYSRAGNDGNVSFSSPTTPTDILSNAFNLLIGPTDIGNNEFLGGRLSLLESRGVVRVLAEPSLTVMSGQTATFLAGGEFPVPVSQSGSAAGGGSAITVEYKQFGVRLPVTPTVLSRDRIALKVAPEVSDLDFTAGIQIGGVSVPALTVRRTETTIELGDGESFVISGLISNNLIANVDKVPWLGDIPILGAFFKSVSYDRTEKELIMVVTPHLVRPLAREAKLPPLPGQKLDSYKPGFGAIILEETGEFDTEAYGFSK